MQHQYVPSCRLVVSFAHNLWGCAPDGIDSLCTFTCLVSYTLQRASLVLMRCGL